jgi:hypothetical protein
MVGMLFSQDITEIRKDNETGRARGDDCQGESMEEEHGEIVEKG